MFSPIETSSSASSSPPESNQSMAGTSTSSSLDSSPGTGQPPPALSGDDSPPNAPIVNPQNPGPGLPISVENDPRATLNPISDLDMDEVLTVLRNTALNHVKLWQPKKSEIVPKKARIVKWILKPEIIHKSKTGETTLSISKTSSIWKRLVDELFPEINNKADLIKYFRIASRSTKFFGELVETAVNFHQRYCTKCGSQ